MTLYVVKQIVALIRKIQRSLKNDETKKKTDDGTAEKHRSSVLSVSTPSYELSGAVTSNVLEVGVHSSLMHTHDLPEHVILSRPKPLFSLPATAFLRLPQLPVTLGKFDHGSNAPLLLKPEQLLGQLIQRLGDHGALHGLENAIEGFLSELFNVPLLLHCGRSLRATFSGSQFIDQIEAFFLR